MTQPPTDDDTIPPDRLTLSRSLQATYSLRLTGRNSHRTPAPTPREAGGRKRRSKNLVRAVVSYTLLYPYSPLSPSFPTLLFPSPCFSRPAPFPLPGHLALTSHAGRRGCLLAAVTIAVR
ncbi:hypothetical protein NP493_584g01000 [Ridgeia piscesae]|uniref:Uncharacterized protein n=1 Tax=Ridgeia piscesae TaxID=27915 RepID=A0AAD9KU49_RIDPI|nr:hypothetical protein NP493_584g01000 [Ridgeia piscesae]